MILQIVDLLVKKAPRLSSSAQIQCFAPPAVQATEPFCHMTNIPKRINLIASHGGQGSSLLTMLGSLQKPTKEPLMCHCLRHSLPYDFLR